MPFATAHTVSLHGAVGHLIELSGSGPVILLTATRDVEHSGARVLMDHLISLTGS